MDFYELQAFVTLAEELHFAKAALKLHMSPSTLSRLITRLESENNVHLLLRDTRQVCLTEEGKNFYHFAQDCLLRKNQFKQELSGKSDLIQGTLKVYASVTACYSIMPNFVAKLSKAFPHVQLSVETGDPALALQTLKEKKADICVSAFPERDGFDKNLSGFASFENLELIPIKQSPLVFVSATSSPYGQLKGSLATLIEKYPVILPKEGLARKRFNHWVKSNRLQSSIAAETAGNEAILALVQLGLGIGLVPEIVLDYGPFADGLVRYPAGNELGNYTIGYILRKETKGNAQNKLLSTIKPLLQEVT